MCDGPKKEEGFIKKRIPHKTNITWKLWVKQLRNGIQNHKRNESQLTYKNLVTRKQSQAKRETYFILK